MATLLVVILALSAPELRPSPDRGAAPRDHVNIPAVLARVEERAATRTSDGLRGAAAEILAALTITEDDSRLLAEAAEIHHLIAFYEIDDPLTANAAAEDLAERALQRDPTLRQAWAVLASVRLDRDWDLAGAARDFRAALRGEPDDVLARHWTAWWLLAAGRTGEAAATVANAAKLAPLSPAVITARATFSYFAGDYRGAERDAVAALVITPDGYRPHLRLGVLHTVRGEETKAIAHLQRAHELAPDVPETIATLGHASAVFGRRLQAEAYLRMLDERSSAGERLGYHRAMVLHGLGRGDEAVEALLSARRHGALSLGLLRAEPRIAALRRDSRIARLIDAAAVTAQPTFFPDRPQ
ncbi:MAG TPA: hypothetical protein VFO19_04255 [Vicinamibacterales bacterium]|nr:hypothetical protein [Vicinamibacterales bacterium]